MLIRLGFHLDWVTLIIQCVGLVLYTVGFNGFRSAYFEPSQGIRQADHLSSYLFLIFTQGFFALFDIAQHSGVMSGVRIGRSIL